MTDHLAIMDSAAPSFSLERAARSYHEERIPLSPPLPDRDLRWRWAVAILAAILLHIGVVTTIDDGFQREQTRDEAPVPVEIVTEPAPSPPPPKPVEKPEEKPPQPPQPQQPEPARSSGGEEENLPPGEAAPAPKEEAPTPPPVEPPAAPIPEEPAPTAAPALPAEPSPQAEPVPPASTPLETQQALVPPPVPLRKPPTPPSPRTTTAATTTTPATSQEPAQSNATAAAMDLVTWEQVGGGDKYLNAMRDKIKRLFYYPPTADMFRWMGTAVYELTINRQGEILDIQLTRSSRYDVLDKAGFTAIRRASPFDPLPTYVSPRDETVGLTLILPMPPPE